MNEHENPPTPSRKLINAIKDVMAEYDSGNALNGPGETIGIAMCLGLMDHFKSGTLTGEALMLMLAKMITAMVATLGPIEDGPEAMGGEEAAKAIAEGFELMWTEQEESRARYKANAGMKSTPSGAPPN